MLRPLENTIETSSGPAVSALASGDLLVWIGLRIIANWRRRLGGRGRLEMDSVDQLEPHLVPIARDVEKTRALPRIDKIPTLGLAVLRRNGIFDPDGLVLARSSDCVHVRLAVGSQSTVAAHFMGEDSPDRGRD